MSFPTKPGDTFTARAIGTYPELPDPSLDPAPPAPGANPTFWATHDFADSGAHVITFTGPLGTVVVELRDGTFTHYQTSLDGPVLRRVRWNGATGTWEETAR